MKNSYDRALYTLCEWESMVEDGKAFEPVQPASKIPIECPSLTCFYTDKEMTSKICRSKLCDTTDYVFLGASKKRIIECKTCGWKGVRSIGRDNNSLLKDMG